MTLGGLSGAAAVVPAALVFAVHFDFLTTFAAVMIGACGIAVALSGWVYRRRCQIGWLAFQGFAAGALVLGATFGAAYGGRYLVPGAGLGVASVVVAVVAESNGKRPSARKKKGRALADAPFKVLGYTLVGVGGLIFIAGFMLFAYQLLILGVAFEAAAAVALSRHYFAKQARRTR